MKAIPNNGAAALPTRILSMLAAFAVAGCIGEPGQAEYELAMDENDLVAREAQWQAYRSEALQSGDLLLAEGDLFFSGDAELRAHFDREYARTVPPSANEDGLIDKLSVFSSGGVEPRFEGGDAVNIKYCVDDGFSNYSTVVSNMSSATRSWERITNVNFIHVSAEDDACDAGNDNVDFAVIPVGEPMYHGIEYYNGCAANKFGFHSCQLENGISVNGVLAMRYHAIEAPETGTGVLRHELGHILGFGHEHPWVAGACGTGETKAGLRHLTAYDPDSVMHYRNYCDIDSDFTISELDGFGARQIYGLPMSWHVATQMSLL